LNTQNGLRKSGLKIVGNVPWGTHFCQFYRTQGDLTDILVPYFKGGLENNEFCLWIITGPLSADDAKKAMKSALPNFDQFLADGQIEIVPYDKWYLKKGVFDSAGLVQGWMDKLDQALGRGYDGLRLAGDNSWLEPGDWSGFIDYEAEINDAIGSCRMLAVCTYSLEKCGATEIIDVVQSHQFALVKRADEWELIESSERRRIMEEHQQAFESLQRSEAKYRSLFENLIDGFAYHKIILDQSGKPVDYVFLEVNDAFEKLTGLKRKDIIGKAVTEVLPGIEKDPADWIGRYGKVALTGEDIRFEQYAEPLNKWYSVSAYSPMKNYFVAVFEDITVRKRSEKTLRESHGELEARVQEATAELNETIKTLSAERKRFNEVLDVLPAYVVLLTPDYYVPFANRFFRGRFGESHGRRCFEYLFDRSEPCEICDTFKVLKTMEPHRWEWTGPDGRDYDIFDFPFTDADGSTLILEMGIDITERKQAEAELEQHRNHLEELVQQRTSALEAANKQLQKEMAERKQAEEAILQAKDEWERTFNSVPDMIAILDNQHRIKRVNEAMANRLGLEAGQCAGLPCYKYVHGLSEPPDFCPHTRTLKDGVQHIEEVHEDRLGGDFMVSTSPLLDGEGKMFGSVHVARDITEQKRVQESLRHALGELQQRQTEIRALLEASRAVIEQRSFEDTARLIFDSCKKLVGATAGYIALLCEDGTENEVIFLDAGGLSCTVDPSLPMPVRGLRSVAYRTGKAVYENDFPNSEWVELLPPGHAVLDSALFAPLMIGGEAIGLLGLANKPGGFSESDTRLAAAFSELAAMALHNSRLFELLRESEGRLRSHVENSPMAVVECDADLIVTRWAGEAEKIFGWNEAEVVGKKIADLNMIYEEDIPVVERVLAQLADGVTGHLVSSNRNHTKDGRVIYCEWYNSVLLNADGDMASVMSLVLDVTERKKAEELKDEFIGMVSHELKTPLTVLTGAVHTSMSEDLPSADRNLLLQDAAKGVEKLNEIVDNLLELSRLEGDRLALEKQLTDVDSIVRELINRFRKESPIHRFQMEIASEIPPVLADKIRVERILHNLLDNAVKYSPRGGEVTVSAQQQDAEIVISVKDRGIGISPEGQSRLFERFERLEALSKHGIQGVGLGLNVCRLLAEAHGGEIWVESAPDKGSTFYFSLPLAKPESAD